LPADDLRRIWKCTDPGTVTHVEADVGEGQVELGRYLLEHATFPALSSLFMWWDGHEEEEEGEEEEVEVIKQFSDIIHALAQDCARSCSDWKRKAST
jgi:hypothetical protein